MLRSLRDLERYSVSATDGDIGHVRDFLIDDEQWTVSNLVVDTGDWLSRRKVLISPISFRATDWATCRFHLALTMEKIRHSPSVDLDQPVSRQHELDHYGYYGYPYYWGYPGGWGLGAPAQFMAAGGWNERPAESSDEPNGDKHLRSINHLRGYHIQGKDDAIGHVEDFIVDEKTWAIRYLVIDTSNWWLGKKVIVAPHWASRVSWEERTVYLDLTQSEIKNSPEWDAASAVNREYETRLYDYYGRPAYWGVQDDAQEQRPGDSQSHP